MPAASYSSYQPEKTVAVQSADNFHAPGIRLPFAMGQGSSSDVPLSSMNCPDDPPLNILILDFGFWIAELTAECAALFCQSKIENRKSKSVRFGQLFALAPVAVLFGVVFFVRHGLRQVNHR
jgi:hypothetical protein